MRVPEHDSISVPPLDPRCCRPLATRGSGRILAAAAACALIAAACTGGDDSSDAAADSDAPTIVATTNIWADVVENVTCNGLVHVESLMPPGADPHTFEPSLRDRADMADASLVVANGLGLEESLEDTLDAVAADGTPVFSIGDHLEPITIGEASSGDGHDEDGHDESDHDDDGHDEDEHDEHGHDESDHDDDGHDEDEHDEHGHDESDHDDDGHDEDEHDEHGHDESDHDDDGHDEDGHSDEHGHDHAGGADPHIWFDPVRISDTLDELAHEIAEATGLSETEIEACASEYREALHDAHHVTEDIVAELEPSHRVLVTNHDALGYFADRYGFRVVGSVIPATTTAAEASIAHLEALAEIIEHEDVAAIFSETTHSTETAEQLAAEIGDVQVVSLDTGSLGPAGSPSDTYIGLLTSNAAAIVAALQSDG
ncbi:metal ABC transporter substrate-binding protein [Candidatus Poriferisodalis sp.]|uniref:metal ABC transporter substrate-binding protein n=1 Tax=Candidatus Poriferisodalis sp. TaxID=3101277 RepID=UPI003B52F0EA